MNEVGENGQPSSDAINLHPPPPPPPPPPGPAPGQLLSYGDNGIVGNVSAPVTVGFGGWLDFVFLFGGKNAAGENRIYAVNQSGQLLSYGDNGTVGNVSAPVTVGFGGWLDFVFLFSGTNAAGENRIYAVNQSGQLLSYGDNGTVGNVSAPVTVGFGGWLDFVFLFGGKNAAGENRIYAVNQSGQLLSYGDSGTVGNVSDPVTVGFGGWLDFMFLFGGKNAAGEDRIYAVNQSGQLLSYGDSGTVGNVSAPVTVGLGGWLQFKFLVAGTNGPGENRIYGVVSGAAVASSGQTGIKHIFVLVMENRSYDHFLGASFIRGTDAETGQPTLTECQVTPEGSLKVDDYYNDLLFPVVSPQAASAQLGISSGSLPSTTTAPLLRSGGIGGVGSNPPPPPPPPPPPSFVHHRYFVTNTAGDQAGYTSASGLVTHDLKHQFDNVMTQLCGQGSGPNNETGNAQLDGKPYPPVQGPTTTGFVADYEGFVDVGDPGEPMRCFDPKNLPVLNALAKEFVVCDHWFSSMPGPTETNRMFVHAATSGVWDDSPSTAYYIETFALKQFGVDSAGASFANGTIFDALRRANIPFRIYTGDSYPQVGLLAGISILDDLDSFDDFAGDVSDPGYDAAYTFIEPRYDTISQNIGLSFVNNSQHPANSVELGEQLIKDVYDAVSKSQVWNQSMLIILWDEHGGFYDHVTPPRAKPTGSKGQAFGFMFDQYGVRVPAVVISPLCPRNMIEHRQLEHSFIPATIEQVFGLNPLTVRDTGITGLQTLATLATPRQVSLTLPDPVKAPLPSGPVPVTVIQPATPSTSSGGAVPAGGTKVEPLAVNLGPEPTRVGSPVAGPGPVVSTPTVPTDSSAALNLSDPWLSAALAVAMKAHMEATPADAASIQARVAGLKTVGDLAQYYNELTPVVDAARTLARQQRVAARKQPVS